MYPVFSPSVSSYTMVRYSEGKELQHSNSSTAEVRRADIFISQEQRNLLCIAFISAMMVPYITFCCGHWYGYV